MTRIIINDVANIQDLYNALAAVTQAFDNPEKFESEEESFSKRPAEDCDCDDCQRQRDTERVEPVAEIAAPEPYIPCPRRGTHLRLTECWACWCDVHRGACLEVDVLAPEAWDLAIGELVAASSQPRHRASLPVLTDGTEYVGRHRAYVVVGEVVENDGAA